MRWRIGAKKVKETHNKLPQVDLHPRVSVKLKGTKIVKEKTNGVL
ncbi:hypothetical protein D042_1410 [Vibrio parahaemolyticus NIHCB0757]|nr:hypothetical protein D042_1410 [Vibrio parahaemolyticus NIHCB0757]